MPDIEGSFDGQMYSMPSRYEMLMTGELKIEDLDDRELQRGQLLNRQGNFRGRPSNMIPRKFALAVQEEYKRRITLQMQDMLPSALKSLSSIVRFGDDVAAPRLPAVKEVLERTIGKVTDKKEVETTVKLESVQTKLAGYLVPAAQPEALEAPAPRKVKLKRVKDVGDEDVVEAEVVED